MGIYFYTHFKDAKAEALRAYLTLPKSNSPRGATGPILDPALCLNLRSLWESDFCLSRNLNVLSRPLKLKKKKRIQLTNKLINHKKAYLHRSTIFTSQLNCFCFVAFLFNAVSPGLGLTTWLILLLPKGENLWPIISKDQASLILIDLFCSELFIITDFSIKLTPQ